MLAKPPTKNPNLIIADDSVETEKMETRINTCLGWIKDT